jgi:hypothetical protein
MAEDPRVSAFHRSHAFTPLGSIGRNLSGHFRD